MPMVGAALGAAIKAAIDGVGDPTDRSAVFEAMGTAIVTYITTNAVVAVASVAGVTPGGGASGPGTGTIT